MREWRRGNFFSPYMGESPTDIIQVTNELKSGGDVLSIPIVGALRGPGVSTGPLTGNEEKLDNYGMRLWVDWARNAVLLTRAQMRKSSFEQLEVVRPLLTEWGNALLRDDICQALMSIPTENPPLNLGNEATAGQRVNGLLYFEQATQAQKDTWQNANSDRVLYGAARSNLLSTHLASLANLDDPTDRASAKILLLAKRMARGTSPTITPYMDNEDQGREWFVLFCGSEAFRDLAADPAIVDANTNARPRETSIDKNPLFADGDLQYRGIIIREVPEISDFCTIPGVGAALVNAQAMFLCGQNAVAVGWGQTPKPTQRAEDDYGFLIGRGVEAVWGVGKVFKKRDPESSTVNLIQWGIVTIFVAAPPDT
jgi:hypothetical protein